MRVAVKRIKRELLAMDDMFGREFDREVQLMQTVRHSNIVLFFGAGHWPDGTHECPAHSPPHVCPLCPRLVSFIPSPQGRHSW